MAPPGNSPKPCSLGAAGIQVGTAFAFCEESGIRPDLKQQVFQLSREGKLRVFTDPLASPTGFPFKVVQLPGTLSDAKSLPPRTRLCDLGYLRHAYRKADGTIGYRCPAEPVEDFIRKGGTLEETAGPRMRLQRAGGDDRPAASECGKCFRPAARHRRQ